MCVCPPLRLLITSDMIWTSYNWLNKFYNFYVADIVSIISTCSLTIEACHRNQLNKSKLVLYKSWIHFYSHLIQSTTVIKVDVAYMGVRVLRCLKEELSWAADKRLWIISNIMLFKTVIPLTKKLKNKP